MALNEELKAQAEERVNDAEAALHAYVESKQRNPALLKTLIENVNRAITDYLKFVDQQ